MNAVEIEEAITKLAEQEFDSANFAFAFLEAFGNKETTIKRLKSEKKGCTNASDLKEEGGVLQRNNIHILVSPEGETANTIIKLKESPSTEKAKAKFILATDGKYFEAEDLSSGETVACNYKDFPNHFGFFLPLAGISTVKQIRDSSFDIRATSRLNKLYVELLRNNPDWDTEERRHDMNHFMARLIFCFFAEDTDIFTEKDSFTDTIAKMSESNSSNTHGVIGEVFHAMNTKQEERKKEGVRNWADKFPYVNGGLFSGSTEAPVFTKIARSYLLHVGSLDWTQINPDIFGSMIQAVADDEERGSLGMHYTSVPNILKVLNPLFLDDLRHQLEQAGNNARKLLNLRKRMSNIRVFDPACGSGNFLVIAYKQMREIESQINIRRGEAKRASEIPLTNFRGIEIRDFPAEIARLALIIAEYQCDLHYRDQKLALAEFLPLDTKNWITRGNALRLDWLSICPPTGTAVKVVGDDLFEVPADQAEIEFENEGGETYICGNPPYKGSQEQTKQEKSDLRNAITDHRISTGSIDYVLGWFWKGAEYLRRTKSKLGLVTTNSVHQGRQVAKVWPPILSEDLEIAFARPSFKWSNLASNKAGVTVSIIGISELSSEPKLVFAQDMVATAKVIGPYLVPDQLVVVPDRRAPLSEVSKMLWGNMPNDDRGKLSAIENYTEIISENPEIAPFIRNLFGTEELVSNSPRKCFWDPNGIAPSSSLLDKRIAAVKAKREESTRETTQKLAKYPFRFGEVRQAGDEMVLIVSGASSETREYLPIDIQPPGTIVSNLAQMILDAPLWNMALIASRLHLVWIATVCGKLETRYRYSNTLGWNTFPVPKLTEKNKEDLNRCAEEVLLAREAHFPKTIADLYDPENMPDDLRRAHDRNDEVLERIYIGRRFKNDTERLEKLFDLYTETTDKERAQ